MAACFGGLSFARLSMRKFCPISKMPRILLTLFFVGLGYHALAQPAPEPKFPDTVYYADFSDADKPAWPAKNDANYQFLVSNGKYAIISRTEGKTGFLFPKGVKVPNTVSIEASFAYPSKPRGVLGIAFAVADKAQRGYVFQINGQGEYRLLQYKDGKPIIVTQGRDGWVENEHLQKPPKSNRVRISMYANVFNIYLNSYYVDTWRNWDTLSGDYGFQFDGVVTADIAYFKLMTNKNLPSDPWAVKGGKGGGATDPSLSGDAATLSKALVEARQELRAYKEKYEGCSAQVIVVTQKQRELEKYIQSNLNIEQRKQMQTLDAQLKAVAEERDALKKEVLELRAFKKDIQKSKDGDLVTALTNSLQEERKKSIDLEARLKKCTNK